MSIFYWFCRFCFFPLSPSLLLPSLSHSYIIQDSSSKYQIVDTRQKIKNCTAIDAYIQLHVRQHEDNTSTSPAIKPLFPQYDIHRINSIPIVVKTIAMLRRPPSRRLTLLKFPRTRNFAVLADPRRLFWILHARNIFRFRESNFACRARLSSPPSSAITDSSPSVLSSGCCYPWYISVCVLRENHLL